ncbi:unnamed protein product [Alternaria alternata]
MSTTRRVNHFFKRILKGRQERTKDGKSAAHSSNLTETLCANCSDIDLFAILKGDHKGIPLESGYEVWITRSSDPTTIWIWGEQPGCEFCEFVSAAELHLLPKDASKRPQYLQLDCGKSFYRDHNSWGCLPNLSSHVNIVFDTPDGRRKDSRYGYSHPDYIVSFSASTDVEMLGFQPSPLQVNEVSAWLDLNNTKRHLQDCLRHHASCDQQKEVSSSRLSRLRVIDCSTRSIITPSSNSPYVALSYRWGENHSRTREEQTDILPANLPATIEDAISVTRSLGFQYLWVDKYCVSQTDQSDFKRQIRQMHLIYRSAQITIIAAGGMDANSGLVGFSTPRASMQTKGRYGNLSLTTFSLYPWSLVLHNEGWIGRGWTLQEGYFSRRRLFFTDKQVLFDCERGVISEDLQLSQIQYVRPLQRAKPGLVEEDIQSLIEDYTRRVLTHSDDILNAFDGILADLEQNEPPIRSYWGIVMKSDSSGYLDGLLIGLCWFHPVQNEKIYRRLGFPSWSWAGWSYNPCVYYKLRRQADTKLVIAPSLAIRVEKQCGLFEAWKTFEEASPASTQRHDYSQRIHISAPSLKVRLLKGFSRMAYHGREIRGHCGWVVRSEEDEDDYWSERTYLDTSLENLESLPDTYKPKETRTCHAIYLFSADRMRSARDFSLVHNIFSMLLVSKVGTNWERVGLWQQSFESDQEAQVFDQWLKSSPTYKTRDFWIA